MIAEPLNEIWAKSKRNNPQPGIYDQKPNDYRKDLDMLVLKRKEGQWVEVTHRSGDVLRIRVCKLEAGTPGQLNLAFDDDARHFEIERPERRHQHPGPVVPTSETSQQSVAPTLVE